MKKVTTILALAALSTAGLQTASGHDHGCSTAGKIFTGVLAAEVISHALAPPPPPPVYVAPPPVYVAPPVVVYPAPRVVEVAPSVVVTPVPTVVVAPAPAVVITPAPTVVVAPPVIGFRFGFGFGHHPRHLPPPRPHRW